MRNLFILSVIFLATLSASAQTQVQRGVARMITHNATDPTVPVSGVEIVVGNVASSKSDKSGRFSMNIAKNKEQSYSLTDVRLPKGSNLLLASPSKKKKLFLSKNDLEVALITPEDKNTVSKATYRKLLRKYNAQAEQLRLLRTQLEDQRIDLEESSAEYKSLSTRIDSIQALLNQYYDEKNRESITKEIERIAEELTLTDYQSLEAEDAHIYDLMQEGDWPTLSAYLLKLMNGNAAAYVQEAVDQKNAAKEVYDKASQKLAHRLERLENAIESFYMQCLDDSVSYYFKILTQADTTNFENLFEAGRFELRDYGNTNAQEEERKLNCELAKSYIQQALRHTDVDTLQAWCHSYLGLIYEELKNYASAEKHFLKAMDLRKVAYGDNSIDVGNVYLSLSVLYGNMQDSLKMIKCNQKWVDIEESNLGETHPYMISPYGSLAHKYLKIGNNIMAEKYYTKAIHALDASLRDKSYFEAYYNLGYYDFIGDYEKAMAYHVNMTKNRIADMYYCIAICQRDDDNALRYCKKALEQCGNDWYQTEYVQKFINDILNNKNK